MAELSGRSRPTNRLAFGTPALLVVAIVAGLMGHDSTTPSLATSRSIANSVLNGPWSIVASPNPPASQDNTLDSVSCVSVSDCWAVGYSVDQTLTENWNGTSWSIVPSPNLVTDHGDALLDVTCVNATDCWAVGWANPVVDGIGYTETLVENWNGTSWSIVPSPNVGPQSDLDGVSCISANDCWAVGRFLPGTTYGTLIENWNGTYWSIVPSPSPSPSTADSLTSVSCVTAYDCWALGNTDFPGGFAEFWNGSAWTLTTSPAPFVSDVTCVSANECWAVGFSTIESWDGTSWTVVPTPGLEGDLSGISCMDADHCWAVGSGSGTLVMFWNGTDWSVGVSQSISPSQINSLSGVFCGNTGYCQAVGYVRVSSTTTNTLIETTQWITTLGTQSITFTTLPPSNATVGGSTYLLTATGGASGNPVTFTIDSSASSVCSISGSVVSFTGPGTCTIDANQAGNANYLAAPQVQQSFNVQSTGGGPPPPTFNVSRIYGTDAVGTSLAVSQAEFPNSGSAKAAVLARSDFFSDALAGGPLAAKVGGPLLITPGATQSTSLDPRVQAEIQRVLPAGGTVYILGGPLAMSTGIDTQLQSLGYVPQRIFGQTLFGTAVAIAEQLGNPSTIFEATGSSFYDALSSVPAAIATGAAILLTNGTTQASETATYLAAHPGDTRYAIGGPYAAYGADPTATPVYGQTLYDTATMVASTFFPNATIFGASTAQYFSDALSGGVFMGARTSRGPVLLVPPSGPLPASVASYLSGAASRLTQGYLFGGPLAVGDDVLSELASTG